MLHLGLGLNFIRIGPIGREERGSKKLVIQIELINFYTVMNNFPKAKFSSCWAILSKSFTILYQSLGKQFEFRAN